MAQCDAISFLFGARSRAHPLDADVGIACGVATTGVAKPSSAAALFLRPSSLFLRSGPNQPQPHPPLHPGLAPETLLPSPINSWPELGAARRRSTPPSTPPRATRRTAHSSNPRAPSAAPARRPCPPLPFKFWNVVGAAVHRPRRDGRSGHYLPLPLWSIKAASRALSRGVPSSSSPLERPCSFGCGMAEQCSESSEVTAGGPTAMASLRMIHSSIKPAEMFHLLPSTSRTRPFRVWCTVATTSSPSSGELAGRAPMRRPLASPWPWSPSSRAAWCRGSSRALGGHGHPPERRR